tara:strand:- start:291 stop:560 length:270 start_codon:yes stop_codon:yes gene_type:complete
MNNVNNVNNINQIKNESKELCLRIRNLTKQLDNNLNKIEETNFLFENIKINSNQVIKKEEKPPAGKKTIKMDNSILYWKDTLRSVYYRY